MPRLNNLLVTPDARVSSVTDVSGQGYLRTAVEVRGLLCQSLCVLRVQRALEGLPGVVRVHFDRAADTFLVEGGTRLPESELREAVLSQVVFPGMRRFLGRLPGLFSSITAFRSGRASAPTGAASER